MTIGQIERSVREYMKDTAEGNYRYPSWMICGAVFDALREITRVRQDARYVGLKLVPDREWPYLTDQSEDTEVESAQATEWPLDQRWEPAARYFAIARCFELDGADTINTSRAADAMSRFAATISA